MNNSDDQRPHRPIELEPLQAAIKPSHGSLFIVVAMCFRLVAVVMIVNIVAMAVRVRMPEIGTRRRVCLCGQAPNETDDVHYAEHNKHASD